MTKPEQFVITKVTTAHQTAIEYYSCPTAKWGKKEQATHFAHQGEAIAVGAYLAYYNDHRLSRIVIEKI